MTIEVLAVSPAPGVIGATEALQFDVRTDDPNTFVRVIVGVFYAGAQMQEFAFAGEPSSGAGFLPLYTAGSSVESVVDAGYSRFTIRLVRAASIGQPMWLDNPKLVIYAFNSAGEEL